MLPDESWYRKPSEKYRHGYQIGGNAEAQAKAPFEIHANPWRGIMALRRLGELSYAKLGTEDPQHQDAMRRKKVVWRLAIPQRQIDLLKAN